MATSWQSAAKWYDELVSSDGHYYHQAVIFPKIKKWLGKSGLLDLACGQGALAPHVKGDYVGLDAAKGLVRSAQKRHIGKKFYTKDVTQPFNLEKTFDKAACVLALQNMADPLGVIQNAHRHLVDGGEMMIVLNHPCFRIPRQSHWGIDRQKKLQYRQIDRYMTPMEIPIHVAKTKLTSFHHPLSFYFEALKKAGFVALDVQEWCSDKRSKGKAAKMENRAREEFPLFLTIVARKW